MTKSNYTVFLYTTQVHYFMTRRAIAVLTWVLNIFLHILITWQVPLSSKTFYKKHVALKGHVGYELTLPFGNWNELRSYVSDVQGPSQRDYVWFVYILFSYSWLAGRSLCVMVLQTWRRFKQGTLPQVNSTSLVVSLGTRLH